MIIGSGMIARSFAQFDREDTVFFCSGVSNSSELKSEHFLREMKLIKSLSETHQKLIYFSSYFVNFDQYLTKAYYKHKLHAEQTISSMFSSFTIYRLPQVVGQSANPKTLTNFIKDKISKNELLSIYKGAQRNLIDVSDVAQVIDYANTNDLFINQVVNLVAPQNYDVLEIVRVFESIMQVMAHTEYLDNIVEDAFPVLLSSEMRDAYKQLKLNFDDSYLEKMIEKYYGVINQ